MLIQAKVMGFPSFFQQSLNLFKFFALFPLQMIPGLQFRSGLIQMPITFPQIDGFIFLYFTFKRSTIGLLRGGDSPLVFFTLFTFTKQKNTWNTMFLQKEKRQTPSQLLGWPMWKASHSGPHPFCSTKTNQRHPKPTKDCLLVSRIILWLANLLVSRDFPLAIAYLYKKLLVIPDLHPHHFSIWLDYLFGNLKAHYASLHS